MSVTNDLTLCRKEPMTYALELWHHPLKCCPVRRALNTELCLPGGKNTGRVQQYHVLVLCGSKSQCRCEHMAHQTLLNTKACFVRVTSECIWWSQQTGWVQGMRNSLERPLLVLTSSAWHCYRLRGQLPLIPLPLGFLCISDCLLPQDNQQPLSRPFSRLQKQCLLKSYPQKV